jgi:osmoprotectant transport system permease protein
MIAASQPVIPNFGHGSTCVRNNHTFCWDWVKQHWSDTLGPALVQHIVLTLIAVGIGFAISLVCALLAHRNGWFERPFGTFSAILYTIPSLALFQLLVPISGLSTLTVEIALVSYTLLILFRNTLTGLRSVPEDTREAARGMGLSDSQMLWKVELPLAVPAIIAGLRVAVVTVISLATIASFIIDQGLGSPIFHALQSNFTTELIAAGALAVILALTADGLLLLGQRFITPWARTRRAT